MRDEKYLELLAEKYPTEQAVCREIINLKAILSLPKGTEHFMSDLHGEYEAFCHILNNCSGVIREKVDLLFEDTLSDLDREEICTLIYYPVEKLAMIKKEGKNNEEWYRVILGELIDIARLFSSKYTRSKVRKAMPKEYAYILDELIHVQKDEDDNQLVYHRNILNTLLELQNADEFIEVLAGLIKRLAVDHLHIVGDIFDRGPCADRIMDLLTTYHSIDIEWGNHDILWMGAAAGSSAANATGPASGFSGLTGAGIGNLTEGQACPGQNADAAAIPEYVVAGNWRKNADGSWQFEAGGRSYASEWAAVHNPYADPAKGQSTFDWFRFDADGRMVNGWYTDVDGNTYYLWKEMDGTQGRMLTGWNWLPGSDGVFHCYYFQEKSDGMRGRLYRNTHTPDGNLVNADGSWVLDGIVQTRS